MRIPDLFRILLVLPLLAIGCGDTDDRPPVVISGTYHVSGTVEGEDPPVIVAVANTLDRDALLNRTDASLIQIVAADTKAGSFRVDLTEKGITAGDDVFIFAFVDADYTGDVPFPTLGDIIGIFTPDDALSPAYTVKADDNVIHIDINRPVYDFDAAISGTITGTDTGPVTLVAYTGEIRSSDFSDISFDEVVGFTTIEKGQGPIPYTLDILPYGQNLPIADIKLFAVLDADESKTINAGDRIGFYKTAGADFLTPINLSEEGTVAGYDLAFILDVPAASGANLSISGTVETLNDPYNAAPTYVAVFDGTDPSRIDDDPVSVLKYFSRIESGRNRYALDLSRTDLAAGDPVVIIGFSDRDHSGGFPNLTPGDLIGFHLPKDQLTPAYTLKSDANTDIDLSIDRTVYDYSAAVSGTVYGPDSGPITLVAYTGEINSSDYSDMDPDAIIGFTRIEKGSDPAAYRIDILPYGQDLPIRDVKIFALLDRDGNNAINAGDRIGFYKTADADFLTPITIAEQKEITGIDLRLTIDVPEPSGQVTSLSGTLSVPDDPQTAYPTYVAVFDGTDPSRINDDPVSVLKYFSRIPSGRTWYKLDLSKTDLDAGDRVIVVGISDRDASGGFPNLTPGDRIGFYLPGQTATPAYKLSAGDNSGIDITIDRTVFDYEASISGTLYSADSGRVTLIAYTGEVDSSDFNDIDFNQVAGFTTFHKDTGPAAYTIDLLPYGQNLPLNDVKIFALFDANGNDIVDAGDRIGFYQRGGDRFLSVVTVSEEGDFSGFNFGFSLDVPEPSGYPVRISGRFDIPEDTRVSAPAYVAVFDGANPALINEAPITALRYFSRIPSGQSHYSLDLSHIDIYPGDRVVVVGFVDRDHRGGFPDITAGDLIGFYAPKDAISPACTLEGAENNGIDLLINRTVYDYTASISGSITGPETGAVTVVAYAGEIRSSDFSAIDFEDVIGFTRFEKGAGSAGYTVDILPWGRNLPISGVKLFVLLDANRNDRIDAGDKIGFYRRAGDEFLSTLTLPEEGAFNGYNFGFSLDVPHPSGHPISISGSVETVDDPQNTSPTYVAVFDGSNPEAIDDDPVAALQYFSQIPSGQNRYALDLSNTGLYPGDPVVIIGFSDKDHHHGVPDLTPGDLIGFHLPEDALTPAYTLKRGENTGLDIAISRVVYDYEASISGSVTGPETGTVTVIAYAGEIASSDFTAIDFDDVIGFTTVEKTAGPTAYTLDILPYGKNLPITGVKIFALLDANRNDAIDAGDKIGFYKHADADFLSTITVGEPCAVTGIDFGFSLDVPAPSGYDILLSGAIEMDGIPSDAAPVYVAVFDGTDPSAISENPVMALKYFSKIPARQLCYSIDLSDTDLKPGDPVLVFAFWDKDHSGGYPDLTPGDVLGFHQPPGEMLPAYTLKEGANSGIDIRIDRVVYDYAASISGTITGTETGDVTVVAYAGEIASSDFTDLDFNDVIGFTSFEKGAAPAPYSLEILPYGRNLPITDIKVFALLDVDRNGEINGGDRIGFYKTPDALFLSLITIEAEGETTGIDFGFQLTVADPSGDNVILSGNIENGGSTAPTYVAVFEGSDPSRINEDPILGLKYFMKIPSGESHYRIDLSQTDLAEGDPVVIIGFTDLDHSGGYPDLTPGDLLGIYVPGDGLTPAYTLSAGENAGIDITIGRTVYDYEAQICGTVLGNDAGPVILIAYTGEITSSDFDDINFNEVIGFASIEKGPAPAPYTIDVLPYGQDLPIENVKVMALLDADGNNNVSGGDRIGFYGTSDEILSDFIIDCSCCISGIDVSFVYEVPHPSPADISIAGSFTIPDGYFDSNAPVFLTLFQADDPSSILTDPLASLKYFYKIPQTDFFFDRDLSRTGLAPGDEAMVIALWDKDYDGGFPEPTAGDKIGLVQNKDAFKFTIPLTYGKNVVPTEGYEFKINKRLYDFTADLDYALDMSNAGNFDVEAAQIIVIAIHVDGFSFTVKPNSADFEYTIDMDYLLGVSTLPGTASDYNGYESGGRIDPVDPRHLKILTALFDQLVVWPENQPPDPLIKGYDHDGDKERTAYLLAVLDKNGNGELDDDDEFGYYSNKTVEVSDENNTIVLPIIGEIVIPSAFYGLYHLPTPIRRITAGTNREQRIGGTEGPFWIVMNPANGL